MRIIAISNRKAFWERRQYSDAAEPLRAWYQFIKTADWATPFDIKADFRHASILPGGRVIFNIAGNKYRLVVRINYPFRIVYFRFVGTHDQYDNRDPQSV